MDKKLTKYCVCYSNKYFRKKSARLLNNCIDLFIFYCIRLYYNVNAIKTFNKRNYYVQKMISNTPTET